MNPSEAIVLLGSSELYSCIDAGKKDGSKRKRRKRTRTSKLIKVLHENISDGIPNSESIVSTSAPSYEKIVFDEDGQIQHTVPVEKRLKLSATHRKASKRSGVYYLKNSSDSNEMRVNVVDEPPSSETPMDTSGTVKQDYNVVLVQLDRHVEVRLFRFPNNYESVVKYWYYNLDQLNRMENIPSFNQIELYPSLADEQEETQVINIEREPQTENSEDLSEAINESATTDSVTASTM